MKSFLMLMVLALSVGCERVRPPVQGRNDPYDRAQIHVDPDLRGETAVKAPIVMRSASGNNLHVQVPIRSTSGQLSVEYRVIFFDENGTEINRTTWFPKTLSPRVPDQVIFNSTSSRAADFQVDFRKAK